MYFLRLWYLLPKWWPRCNRVFCHLCIISWVILFDKCSIPALRSHRVIVMSELSCRVNKTISIIHFFHGPSSEPGTNQTCKRDNRAQAWTWSCRDPLLYSTRKLFLRLVFWQYHIWSGQEDVPCASDLRRYSKILGHVCHWVWPLTTTTWSPWESMGAHPLKSSSLLVLDSKLQVACLGSA